MMTCSINSWVDIPKHKKNKFFIRADTNTRQQILGTLKP